MRTLVPGIVVAALIAALAVVVAPERVASSEAPAAADRSAVKPPSEAFVRAAIRARYGGVSGVRFHGPTIAGGHSPAFSFGAHIGPRGLGRSPRLADTGLSRASFVFYRDAAGNWLLL